MIENVIARRYAKALAEAAVQENKLDQVSDDLNLLADMIDPWRGDISVPELTELLSSPTVPIEEKIRSTDKICEKLQMEPLVSNFLNVLIVHDRIQLTGKIAREFGRVTERLEAVSTAEVMSAQPLTDAQRGELQNILTKIEGRPVRLVLTCSNKLIAGLRVKIGDIMYEGSMHGRLERLGAALR